MRIGSMIEPMNIEWSNVNQLHAVTIIFGCVTWLSVLIKFELIFSFIESNTFEHWFEFIFTEWYSVCLVWLYITCCVRDNIAAWIDCCRMVLAFLLFTFLLFWKWGKKELRVPPAHCRITMFCVSRIFAVAWLMCLELLKLKLMIGLCSLCMSNNMILACDASKVSAATRCYRMWENARVCIALCA